MSDQQKRVMNYVFSEKTEWSIKLIQAVGNVEASRSIGITSLQRMVDEGKVRLVTELAAKQVYLERFPLNEKSLVVLRCDKEQASLIGSFCDALKIEWMEI